MHNLQPLDIENKSFEIIKEEIDEDYFSLIIEELKPVIVRVIHATADFDFLYNIKFTENFFKKATEALKNGCTILTDVKMIEAGISKNYCEKFGIKIKCYMSSEDVIEYAKKNKITRAKAALLLHGKEADNGIIAIGNAPTALFQAIEMVKNGEIKPNVIIGVPVGFVGAEESKNELTKLNNVEYITSLGRKGGTPVAVAIINALLKIIS